MAKKRAKIEGGLFATTEPKKETKPGEVSGKSRVTLYLSDNIMFALDRYHLEQKQLARENSEKMPSKSEIVDQAVVEYLRQNAPHLVDDTM